MAKNQPSLLFYYSLRFGLPIQLYTILHTAIKHLVWRGSTRHCVETPPSSHSETILYLNVIVHGHVYNGKLCCRVAILILRYVECIEWFVACAVSHHDAETVQAPSQPVNRKRWWEVIVDSLLYYMYAVVDVRAATSIEMLIFTAIYLQKHYAGTQCWTCTKSYIIALQYI